MIKKIVVIYKLIIIINPLFAYEEAWRTNVVEAARGLVVTNQTVSGSNSYTRDCSGTVYAAFNSAGYPLQKLMSSYSLPGLGGSQILARVVEYHGSIATNITLQEGDLIFFDNTFDRNKNGKSDDCITHVAIVTEINKATGDVSFVHYNTFLDRIVEQQLNLYDTTNKEKNIILRWPHKNDPQQQRYAGELINMMGSPF